MSVLSYGFRVLGIAVVASLGLASGASFAVDFNVNSIADEVDVDTTDGICRTAANTCTLRAAVMQANKASGVGATIVLPAGPPYTLIRPAAGADGDDNGDLNLTTPAGGSPVITISGAGAATTIIDANGIDRVLLVHAGRTASISGVTLRNGKADFFLGQGGGILNVGTLTVSYSTVSGNSARSDSDGGGIFSNGTLTLDHSTLSGNTARNGGGIRNTTEGTLDVIQSTISGNAASSSGGGIDNNGALVVTNSTISLNNSDNNGGGIYNTGTGAMASVYNSTIVFNEADSDADVGGGTGGGVYIDAGGVFNLRNSVVAGNNLSRSPVYDDCTGTLFSFGRNKFWMVPGCTIIQVGPGSATLLLSLAELGELQNNGGPTQTHALVAPSNMIDGAELTQGCRDKDDNLLAIDQRDAPRPVGARCDIGAFEFGSLPLPNLLFANSFE